jgi:hypothetical protein
MPTCAVPGCNNGGGTGEKVSTFPLPTAPAQRKEWIERLNREGVTPDKSRVCEVHFAKESFVPEEENLDPRGKPLKRKALKPGSMPSLLLRPPKIQKFSELCERAKQERFNSKEAEMEALMANLKIANEKIAEQQAELSVKDTRIGDLEHENHEQSVKLEGAKKCLNDDQMTKLTLPESSTMHWSDETIEKCIQALLRMHNSGYRFLLHELGYPGCSIPTILRKLRKAVIEAGRGDVFLKLISKKTDTMSEQSKVCCLNFDEMAVKPKYEFNSTTQSYVGTITIPLSEKQQKLRVKKTGVYDESTELAHKAMSCMAVGLGEDNLIQLLEFHYTGLSFHAQAIADWMISLINRVRASGLSPKIICMDNNPENHAV